MLDTARIYRNDGVTPRKHIEKLLVRIKSDPLNAFVTVNEDGALQQAVLSGKAILHGDEDLLLGIPIAVKDNISTKEIRTTCSSDILKNYVPTYDAHVIEQLKQRGAIIVGKTNLDEFAMGSTTTTSNIGPTKNPWDEKEHLEAQVGDPLLP